MTDPIQAVLGVDNFRFASQRIAMTSLRSIAASTHHRGVEVRQVELRDITLPPELLRAMARQAEVGKAREKPQSGAG